MIDDLKSAYAWRDSLELSKELVQICEEFSDANSNVLVWHLRQAVVEIPATIAADLQANRAATMEPAVKLVAELELVRKIYPAIDTSEADTQLEKLMERMQSDGFGEREPENSASAESTEAAADEDEAAEASAVVTPPQVDGVHQPAAAGDAPADHNQGE